MPLSPRHAMALDLAGQRFKYEGAREAIARDALGLSAPRFWQVVNHVLDDPAALEHDAATVRRLLRLREARAAARRGVTGVCAGATLLP